MNNAEEIISDLENIMMEITQSEKSDKKKKKQMKKHESNIRDLRDNIKQANLHIIGIIEEE